MSCFVFCGHDGPRGAELRGLHRPAHLAGLAPLEADGRIRHAGPILDEAGEPIGSVIVFEAGSLAEAREIAARDPYVTEGVFERYTLNETVVVFPRG